MGFDDNVFLNCPFDDEYLPLLRPLLFTTIYLGLIPCIALGTLDSGAARIEKLIALIKSSRYSIHDLSRLQASQAGEYYRLNMPFELGLDLGCRRFGSEDEARKRCLVLEEKRFRYQAAISDLSGSDIAVHEGKPEILVAVVRNWLCQQTTRRAPGPSKLWGSFLEFMTENRSQLKQQGFSDRDIDHLPVAELIDEMTRWLSRLR
jgi:hypothetical protein